MHSMAIHGDYSPANDGSRRWNRDAEVRARVATMDAGADAGRDDGVGID